MAEGRRVTTGCNPPANTEYCPGDNVDRGQMAAFMHRLADNQVVDAGKVGGVPASLILSSKIGKLGYAWACDQDNPEYDPRAACGLNRNHNSTGGDITIERIQTGLYQVEFEGLGGPDLGGHPQVTTVGAPGAVWCSVSTWFSKSDATIIVRCVDSNNTFTDHQFNLLWTY